MRGPREHSAHKSDLEDQEFPGDLGLFEHVLWSLRVPALIPPHHIPQLVLVQIAVDERLCVELVTHRSEHCQHDPKIRCHVFMSAAFVLYEIFHLIHHELLYLLLSFIEILESAPKTAKRLEIYYRLLFSAVLLHLYHHRRHQLRHYEQKHFRKGCLRTNLEQIAYLYQALFNQFLPILMLFDVLSA